MSALRLVAAVVALMVSGLSAAGQGLRVHAGEATWHPHLASFGAPHATSGLSAASFVFGVRGHEAFRAPGGAPASGLGFVQSLPGGWSTRLEFASGDSVLERPRYSLLAQLGVDLGAGWGLSFGMQQTRLAMAEPGLGSVTVERLFGNQQVSFTLYSRRLEERALGYSHRVQWAYRVGERGFFGLSLAQGLDLDGGNTELATPGDSRNITLFGRYWFMPNWAVSAAAETQEQVGFARRNGIRFGLHHQF